MKGNELILYLNEQDTVVFTPNSGHLIMLNTVLYCARFILLQFKHKHLQITTAAI